MGSKPLEYAQLLRAMFECMGEGLYAINTDGRVLLINPTAARLLGYGPNELLGKVMHDTTHYKHRDGSPYPKAECTGFKVITRGESVTVDEDFFVRKDGSFIPVSYTSAPLFEGNNVTGAVVAFQDISTRLQQESSLKKAAEHLRLVYDTSHVGTWEWEVDTDVISLSPEFAEIVGLRNVSKCSLRDFGAKTLFYDADRRLFESTLQQALRTNKEFKVELRIRREGESRWVLLTGKSFYNIGNPAVLGLLIDVTDVKIQEDAGERTRKKRAR